MEKTASGIQRAEAIKKYHEHYAEAIKGNADSIYWIAKKIATSAVKTIVSKAKNVALDSYLNTLFYDTVNKKGDGEDLTQAVCLSLHESILNGLSYDEARIVGFRSVHKYIYRQRKESKSMKHAFVNDENGEDFMLTIAETKAGIDNMVDSLALRQAIGLMNLDATNKRIIWLLLVGETQDAISLRIGISQQAIAKRVKGIREKFPHDAIRAMFK